MAKQKTKSGLTGYLILLELGFTGWLMYKSATAKPQPWRTRR